MPALIPATTVLPNEEVPTWKSPNELIHERINFDDTIWGFGLAGGAYYNAPLRVTYVRSGSRAEKAHIYPGDVVVKINGIDSSKLTVEEAHKMILESGIHLQINVTSPEDSDGGYYCYQDPLDIDAEEEEKIKESKRRVPPKVPKPTGKSSHWCLQWPWKSKRKIIYKESNCYLVPSKYEEKHKDTRKPPVKEDDTIVLDSIYSDKKKSRTDAIESQKKSSNVDSSQNDSENIKHDELVDENKEDGMIEQNSSEDKNDDKDVKNIDDSENNENYVEEQDKTVDEIKKDSIEPNLSRDQNDDNDVKGKNSPVNTTIEDIQNNDIEIQDSSVDKINDVNSTDQEPSVDEVNVNKFTEETISADEVVKDDLEQQENENKNDTEQSVINVAGENDTKNDQELNNVTDKEEENSQDVVESRDSLDKNEINAQDTVGEDYEKFEKDENGDIPVMAESEKIDHNTR